MSLELAVQIATVITLLLTAGTLLFGIWSFRKQMNWQVYLTYTERYEKILGAFPSGALESRLRLGETLPPQSEELRICILKYLNLSSEEFFLYQTGFVSKKIWNIWRPEIERAVRTPMLKREWQRIRHEFKSYPEFFAFVERVQSDKPS
ncbi:MAG TPA: hypothetical protein VN688_03745 [Gemmataceae bacterium]|nr:hypothetical protein [Gemmataceae bacterium]